MNKWIDTFVQVFICITKIVSETHHYGIEIRILWGDNYNKNVGLHRC